MILGIIDEAQLQRIQLQRIGKLVHRTFERIGAGTFPRRPHERRLRDIHLAYLMIEGNGGCIVENIGRSGAAALNPPSDRGCYHFAVMSNPLQFAVSACCEHDFLSRRCPMTSSAEHRVSGQFQTDRTINSLGCHGRQNGVRPDRAFTSKGSTYEWTNHAHVFSRQTEGVRDNSLRPLYVLRCIINCEPVRRVPDGNGRRAFHWIMRFSRR